MRKHERKKIDRQRRERERRQTIEEKTRISFEAETEKKHRTIKDYAKKFYEIMRHTEDTGHFLNYFDLHEAFAQAGWKLKNDPYVLWRIWRQAENDFPFSIQFIPRQGWRYDGPPQYDAKKRRKRMR